MIFPILESFIFIELDRFTSQHLINQCLVGNAHFRIFHGYPNYTLKLSSIFLRQAPPINLLIRNDSIHCGTRVQLYFSLPQVVSLVMSAYIVGVLLIELSLLRLWILNCLYSPALLLLPLFIGFLGYYIVYSIFYIASHYTLKFLYASISNKEMPHPKLMLRWKSCDIEKSNSGDDSLS